MWRKAANRAGSPMRVIEVICSDESRASRSRRGEDVRRRREWEPWEDEHLVVDSMRGLDENESDALDFLKR